MLGFLQPFFALYTTGWHELFRAVNVEIIDIKVIRSDCPKDVQLLSLYDRDLPDTVRRNISARRPIAALVAAVAPRVASRQAPCAVRRPRREPNQLQSPESPDRWCAFPSRCCRRSMRCAVRSHRRATTATINSSSRQSPP